VHQGIREVAVSHPEAIIEDPKRGTIALRDTRETSARGRVGFEHDEWNTLRLGHEGRGEVGSEEIDDECLVVEEIGERCLRINESTDAELGSTVVRRVPIPQNPSVNRERF